MDETKSETRNINQLIDLPYSEMTDEEIEIVVQFKAEQVARDKQYEEMNKLEKEKIDALIAEEKQRTADAKSALDALAEMAQARYEKAGN